MKRRSRRKWSLFSAAVLIVMAADLWIGLPIYWQAMSLHQVGKLRGHCIVTVSPFLTWLGTKGRWGAWMIWKFATPVEISLAKTKIADDDLACLKNLTSLNTVYLDKTQITDAGLVHVKSLRHLKKLSLSHTPITDAGLSHLTELPNLRQINLTGTQVTDDGTHDFKKAFSRLKIIR
jgi:Leucine rich repeat